MTAATSQQASPDLAPQRWTDAKRAILLEYAGRISNFVASDLVVHPTQGTGETGQRGLVSSGPSVQQSPNGQGRRLFELPRFDLKRSLEDFLPLAKWSGRVVSVESDRFLAIVQDETVGNSPEEEADIPMEEVSARDRPLLREGAWFYWTIGYRIDESGQQARQSVIRFQRLPTWSAEEIDRARSMAARLHLNVET